MIQPSEQPLWPAEDIRFDHTVCGISNALTLIAGKQMRVSKIAYPGNAASKYARLLQMGNGALSLLRTMGKDRTFVTGERIAWRDGEVEYFAGSLSNHLGSVSNLKKPFFVLPVSDPAATIAEMLGCDPQPAPRPQIAHLSCTVVIMANWSGTPAVLHYTSCAAAKAQTRRQVNGLEMAASDPQIAPFVPRLLAFKTLPNGASISVQSRIPADPYSFSWRRIDFVNEFWLSRKLDGNVDVMAPLRQRLAYVCDYSPSHREVLAEAAETLLEWYESMRIPGGIVHGDFTRGNVLFKGDMMTGIIDWDNARKDGIPQVDVLFMLLNSYRGEHSAPLATYFRQLWADEFDDTELTKRIAWVGTRSNLDADGMKFVGLILWFDLLWLKAQRGSWKPESWSGDLIGLAPELMKWVSRHTKARRSSALA